MSRPRRARLLAGLAAVAVFVPTVGASAADAGDVDVSFTVEAASAGLSIDVAAGSVSLAPDGDGVFAPGASQSFSGLLPATTVTDQRGGLLQAWTVNVSATDFAHEDHVPGDPDYGDASMVVDASNARAYFDVEAVEDITFGLLTGMTVTGAELALGVNDLGTPYTLIAGTTPLGNGSVTYTPSITVDVPAGTPAGTYTGTVTQTVS
jgi:hypothetical protein